MTLTFRRLFIVFQVVFLLVRFGLMSYGYYALMMDEAYCQDPQYLWKPVITEDDYTQCRALLNWTLGTAIILSVSLVFQCFVLYLSDSNEINGAIQGHIINLLFFDLLVVVDIYVMVIRNYAKKEVYSELSWQYIVAFLICLVCENVIFWLLLLHECYRRKQEQNYKNLLIP